MFFSFAVLIPAVVWAVWLGLRQVAGEETLRRLRPALVAVVVVVLAGYGVGTRMRNAVWHTEESLWLDDVQKSPENGRGLMIYGLTQMAQGRYAAALEYFTRALRFTPNYPTLEINLGVVYGAMGQPVEAEHHFLRAMALAPTDDQTHAFYARWLVGQGRVAEAGQQLAEAHRLNPARPLDMSLPAAVSPSAGAINESLAMYQRGEYTGSIEAARRALAVDAKSATAWNNIGASMARLGRWSEAAEADKKALAMDPSLQIARNNLAEAQGHLATAAPMDGAGKPAVAAATAADLLNRSLAQYQAGRFEASVASAKDALRLEPRSAEAWNNVAAGEASLKRWDAAIAAAQRAVALKPDFQLAKNNLAWALSEKEKQRGGK
jgi:tetratricopeptide (TPR) repeat protein